MKTTEYDFTVIGGDLRQVFLKQELEKKGFAVCHYGLCAALPDDTSHASSLAQALALAPAVLAPIPIASKNHLNCRASEIPEQELPLSALLDWLHSGQKLFAGCIPSSFSREARAKGIDLFDYMEDEELAVYNSIATAEGAIAEAITKSPRNLHKSKCLVLGYGRCGKTLAACLKGLFCRVTVCARNPRIRAEAAVTADHVISPDGLDGNLGQYDFIFNTIPCQLLDARRLSTADGGTLILDLASAPGGVDQKAASSLKLSAFQCPGLPGKYAPRSSAEAMAETVLRIYSPHI